MYRVTEMKGNTQCSISERELEGEKERTERWIHADHTDNKYKHDGIIKGESILSVQHMAIIVGNFHCGDPGE